MIFSAAISVAREVEGGTLARLRLTRMSSLDFLAGVSATQIVVALLSLACTLLVARALGFRSEGPLWGVFVIGALTALPVIGLGLVVASFSTTVVRAFLLANLPFMFIMFFSGAVYPMKKIAIFDVAGRAVGLFDVFPTTHAVNAVNRILTLGAGPGDIVYEIVALSVLSLVYFAAGVALFYRMHLRSS